MSDDDDENSDALREATNEILSKLDPKEAKVLRERFGIDISGDINLQDIGKQFDVTRDQIKAIEEKALRKLEGNKEKKKYIACSFCGKPQDKVKKIIKSDTGVSICNECVETCNEILNNETEE